MFLLPRYRGLKNKKTYYHTKTDLIQSFLSAYVLLPVKTVVYVFRIVLFAFTLTFGKATFHSIFFRK